MLHDILGMRLNKVELKDPDNPSAPSKIYELDKEDDFWRGNAGEQYHVVADRASEELDKFKANKEQVGAPRGRASGCAGAPAARPPICGEGGVG